MSRPAKQPKAAVSLVSDEPALPGELRNLAKALGFQVAYGLMAEPVARSTTMAVVQTYHRTSLPDAWRKLRQVWFAECKALIAEAIFEHEIECCLEMQEARLAVGPCLARGGSKGQATAVARARAPHLSANDIELIVDEEAAWWIRHRYERGYAGSDARAA